MNVFHFVLSLGQEVKNLWLNLHYDFGIIIQ